MAILVTGGMGYIGSHTCVALMQAGLDVVILDNLCNSKAEVLPRLAAIAGRQPHFVEADLRDRAALDTLFARHAISAVIHFAGLKAVGESVAQPLRYYDNNLQGTMVLLDCMQRAGVHTLVFSSSATVYGDPHTVPITESFPLHATNPYGRSKLMLEEILRDLALAQPQWRIALLRYFNPVGAHESGHIGEDPNGVPNNLLPYIAQVAAGRRASLAVFGDDYPTPDGTGMRDYIHVSDLAEGHVKTLAKLAHSGGVLTYNLGTGQPYSVLQVLRAFERASGRSIPYQIVARRAGDIAQCYADPSLAAAELDWRATRGLEQMCADAWRWQSYAATLPT